MTPRATIDVEPIAHTPRAPRSQGEGAHRLVAIEARVTAAIARLDAGDPDGARRLLCGERDDAPVSGATALSRRELQVLAYLPSGLTIRQIGAELYLSRNTIKTHTRTLYRKLGVASRSEAIAAGRNLGLLATA